MALLAGGGDGMGLAAGSAMREVGSGRGKRAGVLQVGDCGSRKIGSGAIDFRWVGVGCESTRTGVRCFGAVGWVGCLCLGLE